MLSKISLFIATVAMSLMLLALNVNAAKPIKASTGMYLGNNFPSGEHFNLILHGKDAAVFNCLTEIKVLGIDPNTDDEIYIGDHYPIGECPAGYVCDDKGKVVASDPIPDDGIYPGDKYPVIEPLEDSCPVGYDCEYGSVVNMPRDNTNNVDLLMESGRKGPGKKSGGQDYLNPMKLQVTDACTGFSGSDPAIIRLPKAGDGFAYAVYARVLGKPSENGGPSFSFTGREIPLIGEEGSDGAWDDVWLAGVISNDGGMFIPDDCGIDTNDDGMDDACKLTRWDDSGGAKGKGAKNATNITGLFSFTGSVCYWYEDSCTWGGGICTQSTFCCDGVTGLAGLGDIEVGGLGIFQCEPATSIVEGSDPEVLYCPGLTDPIDEDAPLATKDLYCRAYESTTWIFNIADFVNVLFAVQNDAYNVQVRFYKIEAP